MNVTNSKGKFLISYQSIVDIWKQGAATYLVLLAITYLATGYFSIDHRFFFGFMNHAVYLLVLFLVTVFRVLNLVHACKRNCRDEDLTKNGRITNRLAAFTTCSPFFIPFLVELIFFKVVVHFTLHIILIMIVTFIMEQCASYMLMMYVRQGPKEVDQNKDTGIEGGW